MIKVGVNDNVVITKTTKNDQGTLVISAKQIQDIDPLAALNNSSGSTSFDEREKDFLIYPPKNTDFNNVPLSPKQILDRIGELIDPLGHIAVQYMSKDKVKWNAFKGTNVSAEDGYAALQQDSTMSKIYENVVDQFIALMKPFVGETGKKMRMMFIRQSKAKHYPRLRTRFLSSYPFIEPMTIPASTSKLKFSKYEIDNKLNEGEVVEAQQTATREDAEVAESLFAR